MQHFDFQPRTASMQPTLVKSIQAWKTKSYAEPQAKEAIAHNFEKHLKTPSSETRTAFAPTGDQATRRDGKEPYAFHDVIDIVNPLQHLPVVNMLYRGITGDEIKPASQIIGGSLYGGPVGAVTGTVNAIAQIQTGKDVASNVLTMAGIDTNKTDPALYKNDPISRLNAVASAMDSNGVDPELPKTAMAFVNLSETGRGYTKINAAEGRTAGSMIIKQQNIAYKQAASHQSPINTVDLDAPLPRRDPITQVSLSSMPSTKDF